MSDQHAFVAAIEKADDEAYSTCWRRRRCCTAPSCMLRSWDARRWRRCCALRACFSDVRITDQLHGAGTLGLVFRATISGLEAEGTQVLRLDDEDRIADLTVFLRPIRAAMALSDLMGPKIEKLADGTYGLRTVGTGPE
ncbi:hypothetical protein [Mycolicibacterium mengxianglii]|uniref:hypothetical protein n=1 Tax=Mycolicibacterium mengxianglii TaxID=2736649 RepID=UPI001E34F322|nr:hypothetical protein [Mycolicibacterium mengxianglii]